MEPLCRAVETDLRLSIHTHLQLDERNPFKVTLQDITHFLKMKPLRFFSYFVDMKGKLLVNIHHIEDIEPPRAIFIPVIFF